MELKIASRRCVDQEGRPRIFHYFLTVDQEEGPRFSCENYGIRICEQGGEQVQIPAITTSAKRIDQLLTLLVDNQVGPAGLADVLQEQM